MATTASVGSGRRKRKSIISSEGSSQQKETNKRKKHVEEQSTAASNSGQKEPSSCITSSKDIISEVNFKTKPLSTVEATSHDEAGPSGLQQITSSQENPSSLSREEEQDEDIEDRSTFQQLLRHKDSGIKTKKNKSFLCPKCGRGFTSKKRLVQNHYSEETQTCRYELEAETKHLCPACGNYVSNLRTHYNEETKSCKKSKSSISEEELYAALTEDVTTAKRNAVWRSILKHFKVLKCQNENCNHRANSVTAMKYHAERCGKVPEKFSCPMCDRSYTSKPGLDYHMGTHHHEQHQLPEESNDQLQAEPTMSKRKAAVKAAVHLAKVSTDTTSEDVPQTVTDKQSGAIEDNISGTEWETIKNEFKKGHEVKCPSPHCSLMFKSFSGFKYHVSRCKENKTLMCPLCKKQLTTCQRFQNHMMKKHGIGEEESLDYEYTEVTAGDDDDDGEEVKKQNTQLQGQLRKPFYRTINILETAYHQQLKKLMEELMSREELFTNWQPSLKSWIKCNPRECGQYAPVAKHSMRYCFANSKHGTSSVSQLTLFDATLEDERYGVTNGVIFNVGGPVWSMAWAPSGDVSPSNIQYIAMAAYRTLDETYRMDVPLKHNGLIQLWSTSLGDQSQLPRLSLGIAHDYGCVRSMKWCPSGCAAELTPTIDNSETLSRLGLLALACTDAVVRILSIPYPDLLLERFDPIKQHDDDDDDDNVYNVFVMPKSICCLLSPSNITNQSDFSTLYGQCLDVEWFPRQPHNKIAACFSNGTVVIWDLLTTSSLLRGSHDHCDAVFYPQEHISAHFGNVCRTISWCADDPDFLFTAGYDRRLCLWDLKYPDEPVDKWEKGWCLDSKWPLLSPGVFCLEDCITCIRNDSYVRNLYFHEFQTGKPASIIRSVIPQISFSYCHWKSTVAFGTIDGSVMLKRLPPFIYFFRRPTHTHKQKGNPQVLCFCTRLSADEEGETMSNSDNDIPSSSTSIDNKHLTFYNFPQEKEHQLEYRPDMDPVTAITKVAWNPHHQHCDWLLVATNTGLVRLLKLSS